jgi:shikimate dehydrogenase
MYIQYGLIGKSLEHSFSKPFFEKFFSRENISDVSYHNFELKEIEEVRSIMQIKELAGFNITIPFKESVIPYLDSLDEVASEVMAVNCVKKEDDVWKGYNTDVTGFELSINPLLKPRHKSALIFGDGGASRAIQYVLKKKGIGFSLITRKEAMSYEELNENMIHQNLLLINCTPVGSWPDINNSLNIPYHAITKKHLLFDLIYNPKKTDFLRSGGEMGAVIKNGLEMLEIQAMESWRIWQKKP